MRACPPQPRQEIHDILLQGIPRIGLPYPITNKNRCNHACTYFYEVVARRLLSSLTLSRELHAARICQQANLSYGLVEGVNKVKSPCNVFMSPCNACAAIYTSLHTIAFRFFKVCRATDLNNWFGQLRQTIIPGLSWRDANSATFPSRSLSCRTSTDRCGTENFFVVNRG